MSCCRILVSFLIESDDFFINFYTLLLLFKLFVSALRFKSEINEN